MKKLLALLLALLLPAAALAETYELTLMLDVDEMVMKPLMTAVLEGVTISEDVSNETIVDVMLQLLNNTGVKLKTQEDASAIELIVSGVSLLDLVIHAQDDHLVTTSSLLPKYAIVADDAGNDASLAAAAELNSADWPGLAAALCETFQTWFDALEPSVERGSFLGDAYEGGTVCTTYILTDSDLAGLVRLLLTYDVRSVAAAFLTAYGLDGASLLTSFDALNDRVADEDRYAYVLRLVEDDAGAFVGLSLTVFDETAQVSTLSLGKTAKAWKLVWGMSMSGEHADQNYWLAATYSYSEITNRGYHAGAITEWQGDKDSAYAYVAATEEPLSSASWNLNTIRNGKRTTFSGSIAEETYLGQLGLSGTYVSQPLALDCKLSVYDSGVSCLDLNVDFHICDPIPALDDTYTLISAAASEDAEAYADAMDALNTMLAVRLLKVLPLDKLLPLINRFAF